MPVQPTDANGSQAPRESILLHGHRVTYRAAGEGPALLLLHGVAGSGQTWSEVIPWLADEHTVIAPDLLCLLYTSPSPRDRS